MRVHDCDRCAETLTAANEEELTRRVRDHMESRHGETLSDDELEKLLTAEAYDAMDS